MQFQMCSKNLSSILTKEQKRKLIKTKANSNASKFSTTYLNLSTAINRSLEVGQK